MQGSLRLCDRRKKAPEGVRFLRRQRGVTTHYGAELGI